MKQNPMPKETYKVSGDKLLTKIKQIIKEGNARKIIIKNEEGKKLIEFPITIGAVGVLAAPLIAAVGAMAALLTNCQIEVEKKSTDGDKKSK